MRRSWSAGACVAVAVIAAQPGRGHQPGIVVAQGQGIAAASICGSGGYMLLVTSDPANAPWREDGLQASEEVDRIAEVLNAHERPQDRETLWYRIDGSADVWSVPNPRTQTRTWLILDARGELDLEFWLPADDRGKPGRELEIPSVTLAHMWLNALTC